jgi:hypothetical protein
VVPAEDQGKASVGARGGDEIGDSLAGREDLAQVSDPLVADARGLRNRRLDVPEIDALAAQQPDPRLELRVPDRGRTHVDTTSPGT